ncbi:MAG: hypothetical protein WC924_02200 [Candidatus Gracilibacteria bacterium]
MITDDQGVQILKKMDEQFTKMDDKFKEVNQRMEGQFTKMDDKFKEVNQRMEGQFKAVNKKMDDRFREIDTKLDHVIVMAVSSQHSIKDLITREEFDEKFEKYQKGNVEFKHAIVKRLEKLEEPVAA